MPLTSTVALTSSTVPETVTGFATAMLSGAGAVMVTVGGGIATSTMTSSAGHRA
jgi:hypothetical protein